MASTTYAAGEARTLALTDSVTLGAAAGLVGGSVFGVQMAVGNMLPMVASMIGSESVVVGMIVHLLISGVIGAVYGVVAPRLPAGWPITLGAGIVYGIIWWVLGALVIMPIILGMGEMVLQVGDMQWMSLVGHVFFGIVTAAFYGLAARRAG
jgi:uncharacterized membrane protein YagU involved in acid resistance